MNQETKDIIVPLINVVCAIGEKQAISMEFIAEKLNLTPHEKKALLDSAQESYRNLAEIRRTLATLK